jgi:hypothetical protein
MVGVGTTKKSDQVQINKGERGGVGSLIQELTPARYFFVGGCDGNMSETDRPARNDVRHDLLFTDACHEDNFAFIGTPEIKNKCLHPVWKSYQSSIESIRVMSLLPMAVVGEAVDFLLPMSQAMCDVLDNAIEDKHLDEEGTIAAVDARFSLIRKTALDARPRVRQFFRDILVLHNKRNLVNSRLTRGGFFAILEAQVLGAWSAFDTLTTELCVAVINAKPELLDKIGDRQTTLRDMLRAGGNHDWSGRLGELVKLFIRFDSFKATRDAYKQIFDDKAISAILNSPSALVACLVRTQIVHDGGIVTGSFKMQATELKAFPWRDATIGQFLPLDGKNVGSLTKDVVHCANSLIRAVDGWLHLPPSSKAAQ